MNALQLEWVCNLHDHRKTSQGKWKEIRNSMKHQIGRMWDSKNCRWCQHHKIPIWVKVTWLLLVLKNQFSLFRTQSRISSCWRTHTHCQDEVVAERGQTNRSSGGQRPSLLDRRGHEEAGLAWGWGRSVYYCGRVCSYSIYYFCMNSSRLHKNEDTHYKK